MILKKAERELHLRLQEALHVEAKSQSNKENKLDTGKVTRSINGSASSKSKEDTRVCNDRSHEQRFAVGER